MKTLNIEGADSTRHCMITNENASGGTEAHKLNHCNATLDRKDDLRNEFKRSLLASNTVAVDALGDLVVLPTDNAAEDLTQLDDTVALIDLPVAPVALPVEPSAPLVPTLRYKLLTDDDLRKLPPLQWGIKGILPSHGTAVMFGPSGSGKSFLVLDMLQSLAFGSDWFGHKVKACSVTYIVLENKEGLSGRVDAYRIHHGSTSPNIRYMVQPFRLLNAADINDLVLAIQAAGTANVVVLDTLSRATPGSDENDSKAMGLIIAAATILQEVIGGLVLLVHHTGKDASRGMRGHSSLYAALDCAIEVKRSGDNREWVLAKSKDGADGASHAFKLEVVHLGTDTDGDAITSCVIVANQSAQTFANKVQTLGSNQAIALKALEESLRTAIDFDKDGTPPGRPCLGFEDALAIVTPEMPVEAKHKKERAKQALAGLVKKDVVGMKGDWLWIN